VLHTQTRGELPVVHAKAGTPVALTINIEDEHDYPGYKVEVLDAAGRQIFKTGAPAGPAITLILPQGRLGTGRHTIVVRGEINGRPEAGRYPFEVHRD
jgi:hypothetical protein